MQGFLTESHGDRQRHREPAKFINALRAKRHIFLVYSQWRSVALPISVALREKPYLSSPRHRHRVVHPIALTGRSVTPAARKVSWHRAVVRYADAYRARSADDAKAITRATDDKACVRTLCAKVGSSGGRVMMGWLGDTA